MECIEVLHLLWAGVETMTEVGRTSLTTAESDVGSAAAWQSNQPVSQSIKKQHSDCKDH